MSKNKALNDAFNSGKAAAEAKDYPTAIEKFKAAAEMDPKQHVIFGNMADAYSNLAQKSTGEDQTKAYDGAIDSYKKALELKADDPAYHNNYGLLLARMKKFDDAQTELKTAASLDPPGGGKYFFNLGAVLVNGGNYVPAEEAFKQAIAADPNYADAYYQYGVTLMAKATTTPDGKIVPPPGTVESFQKYLELKPDGKDAAAAKGMLDAIGGGVQTNYQNPDAKKKPPPAKKKSQ
jgi:tetratricopeptide (TPR) repeat protein